MLRQTARYIKITLRAFHALSLLTAILLITRPTQPAYADQERCNKLIVSGVDEQSYKTEIDPSTQKPKILGQKLVNEIAKQLGIPAEVKPDFPWARMMNMTRDGYLDMVVGVVHTSERTRYLYFTDPFYHLDVYVYVHKNSNLNVTSAQDLTNFRRVDVRDSSMGEKLDKLLNDTTTIVNNRHQQIALLIAGRADYFLASLPGFSILQKKYPEIAQIKQLPTPIAKVELMLGISKTSPCAKHMDVINNIISQQPSEPVKKQSN
jgi:ABC-type amino acid transport substrate-binding protein